MDFIAPTITSGILAAALFLARNYIKAQIENSVKHSFNVEIEELKSSLKKSEEEFRASLQARDEKITALRSTVLSGMSTRGAALDKRRLEAIEKLWGEAMRLAPCKILALMTKSIKLDVLIDRASSKAIDAQKYQDYAKTLLEITKVKELAHDQAADKERPFLPPMVWLVFSAYRLALTTPTLQVISASAGLGNVAQGEAETNPIMKQALPRHSEYIDKYGFAAYPHLVEQLEDELLHRISLSLDGDEAAAASVKQAGEIIRAIETILVPNLPEPDPALKGTTPEPGR